MLVPIPHTATDRYSDAWRTEDVRFSPSGRLLAVAATDGCILLFSLDVHARPVRIDRHLEMTSPSLKTPHGLDFLTEDVIVTANRSGALAFFRIPPVARWRARCVVDPIHEADSMWFGPRGTTRMLRTRQVMCGPGLVRFRDDRLFVGCNFANTISTHTCRWRDGRLEVRDERIVIQSGIEIPDCAAVSADGRLIAVSDHDNRRVVVYAMPREPETPARELASLRDPEMGHPHGLCFSASGRTVYAVDAGGPFVYVFGPVSAWDWDAARSSARIDAVDAAVLEKTKQAVPEFVRALEGGAKGLAIVPPTP